MRRPLDDLSTQIYLFIYVFIYLVIAYMIIQISGFIQLIHHIHLFVYH